MEWVAAVIAGVGSGFLSAVFSPFAQRRAKEAEIRASERRALVAAGRALVEEARREQWNDQQVGADPRLLALRPHLSEHTRGTYDLYPVTLSIPKVGVETHTHLLDEVDDLERKWKLT